MYAYTHMYEIHGEWRLHPGVVYCSNLPNAHGPGVLLHQTALGLR